MYWKPVIVGLGSLVVGARAEGDVEKRAIGDVLAGAPISDIKVTASDLAQCGEATISWTGTAPPVSLMVGTGGYYANLQPLQTIDNLDGSSTQVFIDQKEGTTMIFQVTDGNGQVGYVQNLKVGGGDASCLSDGGSSSSSAGESSSSASASSSSGSGEGAAPSVVQPSSASSTWSESEASSSNAPASSAAAAPTQSPSGGASSASASRSPSASASVLNAGSSASASASASSSSNAGSAPVDASAANAPNSAAGLVAPGLAAVGVVVGAAALL